MYEKLKEAGMNDEIEAFLVKAGWDIGIMVDDMARFDNFYKNFTFVDEEHTIVCFRVLDDYLVEVRIDGAIRRCGLGRGCFWTEWE